MSKQVILVLNVGSSSIKFALYPADLECFDGDVPQILRGKIAGIGVAPELTLANGAADIAAFGAMERGDGHDALIGRLLTWLDALPGFGSVVAVGHRIVHGGKDFAEPVRLDPATMADLAKLEPLAPLHQPHNLAGVRAVAARHPDLMQVGCFDTAFHRTQPAVARRFALPRDLTEAGIQRYGFHGLSYEYIARILPAHLGPRAEGRVVVAHLGSGASMCAMRARQSVATTMGFTALDGLVMGRRCGALDPGVVLHLLRQMKMSPDEVEHLLYERSGLLGVSGLSRDMKVLEDSGDPGAEEAIELFCYRAVTALGGLIAALGGLDALVFTAGIGENSVRIRREICARLDWLGLTLDAAANASGATRISADASRCDVIVLPTDEERVIAGAAHGFLAVAGSL